MHDIPFFFSEHTDLTELSLAKMILSAYACLAHGFRHTDLIAYLKCGYAGVSPDDCDLFELYTDTWRIKGRAFTENRPFDMHPRGYVDRFTEEDTARLIRVNGVRERVIPPLLALRDATSGEKTAKEHAEALYRFLTALDTERRLHERAKEERIAGRVAESDRLARLSAVLYDLLDRIYEIMGDLAQQGVSIIMISSELPEVLRMSDRILVMYEGEIVGELDPKKTDANELGLYMSGAKRQGKEEV